jgi:hypothetical protein
MARFGEGEQEAVTARLGQQAADGVEGAVEGGDAGWGTGELTTDSALGGGEAGWDGGFGVGEADGGVDGGVGEVDGAPDLAAYQDADGDGYPDVPDLTGVGV